METVYCRFTVHFEDPYWIGLYERQESGRLSACKVTFGAQPKDYEVYEYLLKNWKRLHFGPGVEAAAAAPDCKNPKRLQRKIRQSLQGQGCGTKAQQAVAAQREQGKTELQLRTRQQRMQEKDRRFALHLAKKKEKHRGR